jgi:uncharacterized protein YndB with AHSA1/START domain
MIERDLAWAAGYPGRVERTLVVAAPPDAVWAVVTDHAGWARWFPGVGAIVRPHDTLDDVGGRRTVRTGPVRLDERFLAWDPARRFAFTGTAMTPPVLRSIVEDIRLEPHGERATAVPRTTGPRTNVRYTIAIDPAGPLRLLTALVRPAVGRMLDRGLAGLARAAEAAPRSGDAGHDGGKCET